MASDTVALETPAANRAVVTPDVLGRAFFDDASAAVLRLWRDGRIQLVLNRRLLVCYFRVLRALGLDERLIRRWGWWFTAPSRSLYISESTGETLPLAVLCSALAQQQAPCRVIHGPFISPPTSDQAWLSVESFLRQ